MKLTFDMNQMCFIMRKIKLTHIKFHYQVYVNKIDRYNTLVS